MRSARPRNIYGLFGAGGFAREVMPVLAECIAVLKKENPGTDHQFFFVDVEPVDKALNGYAVISESHFFGLDCENRFFNVAIADSAMRKRIAERCVNSGAKPFSIRSVCSVVYDCNDVGDGAIVCAYSTITSNARVGKFFHSNIYSYVAHDCVIGDYVTFAPNVHCNGNVHIGSHAYIGTGAIIKQGSPERPLVIGEGAIVGMGAVVTKDVPPHTTVVGNPARPLTKG